VPRPCNAFIIFRRLNNERAKAIEHDHRHISKMLGTWWKEASPADKLLYKRLADEEKARH
ncbi:uncharacterized protein BXZ73DRAFT_36061, partial [Epithele typhae]|uniref:uncharacterized protein n=1 Tax=Epithele typhae TaxID=378194 RepID=UPI0020075B06